MNNNEDKLSKSQIIKKIIFLILISCLIIFILMFLANLFFGAYKSFKNIKLFWESTKLAVKKRVDIFIYVSLALIVFSGIFLFWKQIKNLGIAIKNYLFGSKPSKNWLWNCKLKEGSKGEFIKKFRKEIDEKTKANWCFSFSKNKKYYYINDTDQNAIVNGPPGSGKTQRVLLPNIEFMSQLTLKNKANFIVTDPKKEIIQFTGKTLEENEYNIYALDFSNPKLSLAWNPLSYAWDLVHNNAKFEDLGDQFYNICQDNINKAYESINNTINALNWDKKQSGSMWQAQAKKVILSLTKFLLLYSIENLDKISRKDFNLETVGSMVNLNNWMNEEKIKSSNISSWIRYTKMKASEGSYYWKKLWNDVEALSKTPSETLGGIFVEANSVLMIFNNDEELKRMLRETKSFDMEEIIKNNKPFAIFIHYPDHKPANHFLVSLLIEQIYQVLIENANSHNNLKLERRTFFLIDEFGNLPLISNFDNKITICRSRNIFFMLIVQDYNQLKKYNALGQDVDRTIKSSCQLVYFLASGDETTLREVSNSLGNKTVKTKSYSQSSSGSSSTSESEREKPVMSVAELKEKDPNHLLITKPGNKPILMESLLAYKYFENDNYYFVSKDNLESLEIASDLWDANYVIEQFDEKDDEVARNFDKEVTKEKNFSKLEEIRRNIKTRKG